MSAAFPPTPLNHSCEQYVPQHSSSGQQHNAWHPPACQLPLATAPQVLLCLCKGFQEATLFASSLAPIPCLFECTTVTAASKQFCNLPVHRYTCSSVRQQQQHAMHKSITCQGCSAFCAADTCVYAWACRHPPATVVQPAAVPPTCTQPPALTHNAHARHCTAEHMAAYLWHPQGWVHAYSRWQQHHT